MPPASFAPRMLALSSTAAADVGSADWLGFDLDHAVARYRLPALTKLVHECLVAALVELGHFPPSAFTAGWDAHCMQRGLILDFHTGCSLVLAEDGSIGQAWRGQRKLAADEIAALYAFGGPSEAAAAPTSARGTVWPGMRILRSQGRHDSFFVLLAHFEVPAVCAFQQLVEWVDSQAQRAPASSSAGSSGATAAADAASHAALLAAETAEGDALRSALAAGQGYDEIALPPRYAAVRAGLFAAFNHIFDNVEGMRSGRGGFFSALKANPSAYVFPRPRLAAALIRWRRQLRRRSLLVTNSHVEFAQLILAASLGPRWRDCFDLVVFNGSKPAFFVKHGTPFYSIDPVTQTEGAVLQRLTLPLLPSTPAVAGAADGAAAAPAPAPAVLAMQGNAYTVQAMGDVLVTLEYVRDSLLREREAGSGSVAGDSGSPLDVGPLPVAVTAVFSPAGELQLLEVETTSGVGGAARAEGPAGAESALAGPSAAGSAHVASSQAAAGAAAPQLLDVTGGFPAATPGLPSRRPPLLRNASAFAADSASSSSPPSPLASAPSRARFVYIGDHIHGDVVAAATARLPRRAAPLAWRGAGAASCASRSVSEKMLTDSAATAAAAAPAPLASADSASGGAGGAGFLSGWQAVAVLEELEASLPGAHALGRIGAAGGAPIQLPRGHASSGYAFGRNFASAVDASGSAGEVGARAVTISVSGSGSASTVAASDHHHADDGGGLLPPSVWGSFFVACGSGGGAASSADSIAATCSCCSASCGCDAGAAMVGGSSAASASAVVDTAAGTSIAPLHRPGCRCRGYFCSLLQSHAAACWSDVEAALDALLSDDGIGDGAGSE